MMYALGQSIPRQHFASFPSGLSDKDLDRIVEFGEAAGVEEGSVGRGDVDPAKRRSGVSWLHFNETTAWLYGIVDRLLADANARFRLDIDGLDDPLQYTSYGAGDHYDWHVDADYGRRMRKLSMTLQLSGPGDYEGGALEFMVGPEPERPQFSSLRGQVVAFPAWVLHRVAPVASGKRRSLVAWAWGPEVL